MTVFVGVITGPANTYTVAGAGVAAPTAVLLVIEKVDAFASTAGVARSGRAAERAVGRAIAKCIGFCLVR